MSRLAAHEITIEVNVALNVSEKTANICLRLLEAYMNAHPEMDLIGHFDEQGCVSYELQRREARTNMRPIDADALIEWLSIVPLENGMINPDVVVEFIRAMPDCGGWISVKDRLPEKEGQYLCWFGKNTVCKGAAIATYLEEWKAFGSLESLKTYPNVTHWMSLPEPPKE